MEELKQLLLAWGNGEDCYYAIHDRLLELGYPNVAEFHKQCVGFMCDLPRLVPEYKGRWEIFIITTLECYLENAEISNGISSLNI